MQSPQVIVHTVQESKLTAQSGEEFKRGLYEALEGTADAVVIDLHRVEIIDSYCLGILVLAARVLPEGCRIYISSLSEQVRYLFDQLHLKRILPVKDSVAEVISELEGRSGDMVGEVALG